MTLRYEQTSYLANVSHPLTITSTGAKRTPAMAQYTPVFSIATTVDCWYQIGSSTVTATTTGNQSHFVPAGTILFANKGDKISYVSVLTNGATGLAVITGETQ
jgi:hypothetical protein